MIFPERTPTAVGKSRRVSLSLSMVSKAFLRRGSPIILIALLAALALLSRSLFAEAKRNWRLRSELNNLNKQIAELNGGNRQLADDLSALERPLALEKEARLKYGLRKAGEQVLIIPSDESQDDGASDNSISSDHTGTFAHMKAWWKYFTQK